LIKLIAPLAVPGIITRIIGQVEIS